MQLSRRSHHGPLGGITGAVLVAGMLIGPSSAVGSGGDPPMLLFAGEIADAASYDHVILLWDERLDERVVPVATDFTVTIDTVADHTPAAATYLLSGLGGPGAPVDESGTTIMRLQLPAGVTVNELSSIQIDYQSHGTPLRDLSLTPVADFINFDASVIDSGDFAFLTAIVDADHGSNRLAMVFIGQIDLGSIPAPDRFAVTVDPDDGPPAAVAVTGVQPVAPTDVGVGILDLVLGSSVTPDDAVSVTYMPGANPIQGRNGGGAIAEILDFPALVFLPFSHAAGGVGGSGLTTSTGALTAADPVATTVQGPATVTATIDEVALDASPTGYSFFGEQVLITTSAAATPEDPFVFRFEVDDTAVPDGADHLSVVILRNGTPVGPCTGPPGDAVPTPCVSLREDIGGGDIAITVLTVAPSTWNMAIVVPYAFGGFQSPVDNPPVTNRANAGRAIPVKFSLGGNRGMSIFTAGSPASVPVSCSSGASLDVIEETVSPGSTSLTYHAGTDTYHYVWKTSKAWAGTCRKLLLSFGDGSSAEAVFDFKK